MSHSVAQSKSKSFHFIVFHFTLFILLFIFAAHVCEFNLLVEVSQYLKKILIVTWPFAIMLLTKNCLQIRQKADGNGVPASHRGATSVRDNRGRHPAITEHSGKALNLDGDFPPRSCSRHENEQCRRRLAQSNTYQLY